MAYFNYHAKISKKIRAGELTSYYFDSNYKNIGFCLVLCFDNEKFPVRENHFEEYFAEIGNFYSTQKEGDIFKTTFTSNMLTKK